VPRRELGRHLRELCFDSGDAVGAEFEPQRRLRAPDGGDDGRGGLDRVAGLIMIRRYRSGAA
jgi:hypothetical protein